MKDLTVKLKQLKQKKPLFFYLLIIPIGLILFYKYINKILVYLSNQQVNKAEQKDQVLKQKQDALLKQAEEHKNQADLLEKQIEQTKVGKDWHLK